MKRKLRYLLLSLVLLVSVLTGCTAPSDSVESSGQDYEEVITTEESFEAEENVVQVEEDGTYTSKDEVAAYIYEFGHLPDNFITKKEAKAPEPAVKTYSKEDVRALLAAKANESGGQFKAQVKALVKKYANGGSLTDIPEDQYPALVEEVEGLKDA